MVLVTKDQWEILQKMQAEPKPLLTEDQFEVSMKIIRDLNRYERKRHIAAHMIGFQKEHLCNLAKHNEYLSDQVSRYGAEISELNEEISDLKACLSDEQETVYEQNDEIERLKGRVEGVGWAFEKVIKER